MSLKGSAGKMSKSTKQLMISWAETTHAWRDTQALEFERKYLEPLPQAVETAVKVMNELDKVLTRIRQDCE